MNWSRVIKKVFSIDPSSKTGLSHNGKPAGWNNGRYWRTRVKGKCKLCHIIIMELHIGGPIPDGMEVDHIDRNSFNNKIENLRLVTRQQNVCNTGCRSDSTTGVKGVSFREGRRKPYVAHRQRFGKRSQKSFVTLEEAVEYTNSFD